MAVDADTTGELARDVDSLDDGDDQRPAEGSVGVTHRRPMLTRLVLVVTVLAAVALAALVGWPWIVSYPTRRAQDDRRLFREIGRQGALNHATISCAEVGEDFQRMLEPTAENKPRQRAAAVPTIHPGDALPHE